jgi:hypothetical protein
MSSVDQQGYVRMLALRAMTLHDQAIGKELRPNSSAVISNRKKLPWSLRLPASMCGIGWALESVIMQGKNRSATSDTYVDKWVTTFMLDVDIQEPTIKNLSLSKIRKNVDSVVKSALETWLPAISTLENKITPYGMNRIHVGTMAIVKAPDFNQVGDEVFSRTMKFTHGRVEGAADPCNRIYMVLWELYNKYSAYMLLGRM